MFVCLTDKLITKNFTMSGGYQLTSIYWHVWQSIFRKNKTFLMSPQTKPLIKLHHLCSRLSCSIIIMPSNWHSLPSSRISHQFVIRLYLAQSQFTKNHKSKQSFTRSFVLFSYTHFCSLTSDAILFYYLFMFLF